jgi:hypothetical protein
MNEDTCICDEQIRVTFECSGGNEEIVVAFEEGVAPHAFTHAATGTDPLTPSDIGAASATHYHAISDVTGLGTALAGKQAAGSYASATHAHDAADITSGTLDDSRLSMNVVLTTDSRLSDARTPTAHASTHNASTGSDPLSYSDIGAAAESHDHDASAITTGTIAAARLGSGTASSATYLRGNSTFGGLTSALSQTVSSNSTLSTSGIADGSVVNLTSSADYTLHGMTALSAGNSVLLVNTNATGGKKITLANQSASDATAARRFLTNTATDIALAPQQAARCHYDATASRWRAYLLSPQAVAYDFTKAAGPADATRTDLSSYSSYSWTIPPHARVIEIFAIGAGGGGGSGRKGAANSARYGGGGGGSGGVMLITRQVSDLSTRTLTITVGQGGAGGASVTTDDTNGNSGSVANDTSIVIGSQTYYASRGGPGGGGTSTASSGGSAGNAQYTGVAGGSGSVSAAPAGNNATSFTASGGPAGGGVSTSNVAYDGGQGRAQGWFVSGASVAASGGTAPGGNGTNASAAYTGGLSNSVGGSGGGGAGNANASGNGGNGGNGANYGGPGAGGGACTNGTGNASGAGGSGGEGFVRITVW